MRRTIDRTALSLRPASTKARPTFPSRCRARPAAMRRRRRSRFGLLHQGKCGRGLRRRLMAERPNFADHCSPANHSFSIPGTACASITPWPRAALEGHSLTRTFVQDIARGDCKGTTLERACFRSVIVNFPGIWRGFFGAKWHALGLRPAASSVGVSVTVSRLQIPHGCHFVNRRPCRVTVMSRKGRRVCAGSPGRGSVVRDWWRGRKSPRRR